MTRWIILKNVFYFFHLEGFSKMLHAVPFTLLPLAVLWHRPGSDLFLLTFLENSSFQHCVSNSQTSSINAKFLQLYFTPRSDDPFLHTNLPSVKIQTIYDIFTAYFHFWLSVRQRLLRYLCRTVRVSICWPDLFLLRVWLSRSVILGVTKVDFLGKSPSAESVETLRVHQWFLTGNDQDGKQCRSAAARCSLTQWHSDRVTKTPPPTHTHTRAW